MNKFIACNLDYSIVSKTGRSPAVYINVVIDTAGVVKQASVAKGVNDRVDAEALRVARALTEWITAIHNQEKVDSQATIRVKFDPTEKANAGCR